MCVQIWTQALLVFMMFIIHLYSQLYERIPHLLRIGGEVKEDSPAGITRDRFKWDAPFGSLEALLICKPFTFSWKLSLFKKSFWFLSNSNWFFWKLSIESIVKVLSFGLLFWGIPTCESSVSATSPGCSLVRTSVGLWDVAWTSLAHTVCFQEFWKSPVLTDRKCHLLWIETLQI